MTGPKLSVDRLPKDWYERFGARLIKECINDGWESWPSWHQYQAIYHSRFVMHGVQPWNTKADRSILTGNEPSKPFDLAYACHFFNKSAVLYMALGGVSSQNWRFNSLTYPVGYDEWVPIAYNTWAQECTPRERLDARFAFAPYQLSFKYDQDLRRAIGLGESSEGPLEETVSRLIAFHINHCDRIHARAVKSAGVRTSNDEATIKGLGYQEGHAARANAQFSSLAPTCRAVLLIGRDGMARSLPVLMVLTGHNQDMKTGPPTFDTVPPGDIVSRRADHIIEVSLQTAVRYLRLLERREEAANDEYRKRNDTRREAIYSDIVRSAHDSMERLLKAINEKGDSFEFSRDGPFDMQMAWDRIVTDEEEFKILEVTKALRRF